MVINKKFVAFSARQIYQEKLKASLTNEFINSWLAKNHALLRARGIEKFSDDTAKRNFVANYIYRERFRFK